MESGVKRRVPLQIKMLIGFLVGLAAGLVVHMTQPDAGWAADLRYYFTEPVGTIFLRLLFMLVIPLLFSALVIGVAEMGDVRSLRRVGLKTLIYTVVLSSIAVADRAGGGEPAAARRRRRSGPGAASCSDAGASAPASIVATTGEQPRASRRCSTSSRPTSSPPLPTTTSSP